MTSGKPEFIRPHIEIKEKATFITEDEGKQMIATAKKIVETMQDDYVDGSKKDVDKLKKVLQEIKATPEDASVKIQELFDIANDIKSQGGSFNYNLVSFIGNSLCRFLSQKQNIDDKAIETIQIHIDTIIMVLNRNMTGNGGQMGQEILDGIKAVVQKILSQEQKELENS